jgi:hypothetical protein
LRPLVSKARPVYRGAVVFTTRPFHKRQLLLRPSKRLNQLIEYVVAALATRHPIQLHALWVQSNHLRDVACDADDRIVEVRRDLHALLARAVNAMPEEAAHHQRMVTAPPHRARARPLDPHARSARRTRAPRRQPLPRPHARRPAERRPLDSGRGLAPAGDAIRRTDTV